MTLWFLAWLWQGVVLALGVSAAFRLFPQVNASTRHMIWWCTFAALVWLGCSFAPDPVALAITSTDGAAPQMPPASALFEVRSLPQWLIAAIATLWVSGAFVAWLAIAAGVRGLSRLKSSCSPVLPAIEDQLPLWQEVKNSGRPVKLMICNGLPNAAVLGLHQPYIVFPSRLLDVVSLGELDQILVHEYGHVQRRDDWTRLLQAALEAALWIHPAAHWISRELSLEREVACDDWVVSRTGAARAYAGCLSRVAENRRVLIAPILIPALFGRTPDVVKRVDRLLNPRRNVTRNLSWIAVAVAVCTIGLATAHLRTVPLIAESNVTVAERNFTASDLITVSLPYPAATSNTAQTPEVGTSAAETVEPAKLDEIASTEDSSSPAPSARLELVEAARSRSFSSTGTAPARLPAASARPADAAALQPLVQPLTVVDSRPFHAIYQTAHTPVLRRSPLPAPKASSAPDTRNPWQITGITIGTVTRKATASFAAGVTKASVSFAKSF
jgi:beta-lactamase regulating signal transducer with metallopeptidase domain